MTEPHRIELNETDVAGLRQRLEAAEPTEEDCQLLCAILENWEWVSALVQEQGISIKELKKLIFGAKTEKTRKVLKEKPRKKKSKKAKAAVKGHGRNGADAYPGADRITCPCTDVAPGDRCPACGRGKVYRYAPQEIVCMRGQAPIQATLYEVERLRCNACGAWFRGTMPEDENGAKYDPSVGSMLSLLRYGCGFPHSRLDALQENLGMPLPSSTQWDVICDQVLGSVQPVGEELQRQAANSELFHNDDTPARVLDLNDEIAKEVEAAGSSKKVRTGIFTTGIIARAGRHLISLFFTGRKHAGENLDTVLSDRADGLSPPIHMCDALARNAPGEFRRLLANCLCHGRRNFVKLIEQFPEPCRHVLETLREVYRNDALTRDRRMSDQERLAFHQEYSQPIMEAFHAWLEEQVAAKIAEPNSRMGKAFSYMINHWEALTLFLRVPGAPLDNNVCERALKVSIRHRKNSLFYKTQKGAEVGDLFMSIIHTCRLNGINAFDYLTALQTHAADVAADPAQWLPWNFQHALNPSTAP